MAIPGTQIMAPLPPGPLLIARGLPAVVLPPLAVIVTRIFGQRYFDIDILPPNLPAWQQSLILLASIPLTVTFRIWRAILRDRRDARANGAVLPRTKPSAIGGVDVLRDAVVNAEKMYPGEGFSVLSQQLGEPIINLRILFENRMITAEPEYIKAILATQFSSFEKGADSRDMFSDLLGTGVFLADGDLWKFHRGMTRPFFKRDRVSDFALFDRYSLIAIDKIKQRLRDGFAVDFQDVITRFAMDASGEFLFGYDPRTLEAGLPYPHTAISPIGSTTVLDKDHEAALEFAGAITRAQESTIRRGPIGPAWPLMEFWSNKVTKEMGVIRRFLDPILQAAIANGKQAGVEKLSAESIKDDREVQEGETLVEHLSHYTQDQTILRDEILNIGLAGRDTTSSLLTFVIYMLTDHPHVLAKLRAEIMETVGPTRAPTPDDIREMKYLRAVLNETLRLHPPVPLNMRCTSEPVILPPLKPGAKPFYIPANTKVPYATIAMHRRPDLWGPDVLEWDPERFIDERLHKYLIPNPFIFLPFSAGPRICLGQQFAYHETSVFLVRLLQNFSDVSLDMDAQPPESHPPNEWKDPEQDLLGWKRKERLFVKSHLTAYIRGGVWVRMKEVEV
ncbi:hypothetical protein MIND_01385100 [Mycena indigotica]|uniref:Cytochrome P450 n=1 Tax=Mycena indigotica TaxID=2126181 RepID=A0A8H6RYJ9_9AGAR|nr:uncharacterized protein MIND_01385100 [Mycena indigotica]KAF7289237.1 hypothetical protein MIND_01385100 [Mycena indigotica]